MNIYKWGILLYYVKGNGKYIPHDMCKQQAGPREGSDAEPQQLLRRPSHSGYRKSCPQVPHLTSYLLVMHN